MQPIKTIRTVIIPAAGKGTRILPATQVTAKELLPVYDSPVIQFAIDEAIEAGAERIIVVVSDKKPAICEFLGHVAYPSIEEAASRLGAAQAGPEIVYVNQAAPMGLSHAILLCRGLTCRDRSGSFCRTISSWTVALWPRWRNIIVTGI